MGVGWKGGGGGGGDFGEAMCRVPTVSIELLKITKMVPGFFVVVDDVHNDTQ